MLSMAWGHGHVLSSSGSGTLCAIFAGPFAGNLSKRNVPWLQYFT